MKAIIVDDEQHAIELFQKVSKLFENNLEIVATATNLPDCVLLINEHRPDVVFMDIDMPNYSGLQIQDFFSKKFFEVVYVTAHGEYAIEALRQAAFDYLLKPIDAKSLRKCLDRLEVHLKLKQQETQEKKNETPVRPKRIVVNSHQGTYFIELDKVLYIEASSMYCIIHTNTDQIIVSKPLGEFDYLEEFAFFRVHRSYLVNTSFVSKFSNAEGNEVELQNGKKIPVSRTRKDAFKAYMVS